MKRLAATTISATSLLLALVGACSSSDDSGPGADGGGGSSDDVTGTAEAGPTSDGGASDGADTDGGDAATCTNAPLSESLALPADGVCHTSTGFCTYGWTPAIANLTHVLAFSDSDVWYSGDGVIAHWDGTHWRGLSGVAITKTDPVAGSGPSDVWLGNTLHWNGSVVAKNAAPPPPKTVSLWFASAIDAWAVDNTTTAHHFDGMVWTDSPSGAAFGLGKIHGFATNDVWAVGGPSIRHWNGAAWEASPVVYSGNLANVVGGDSRADFWIGGDHLVHFVGDTSTYDRPASSVTAIDSTSASRVFFVNSASAEMWDGAAFHTANYASLGNGCGGISDLSAGGSGYVAEGFARGATTCPAYGLAGPTFTVSNTIPGTTTVAELFDFGGEPLTKTGATLRVAGTGGVTPVWGVSAADQPVGVSQFGPQDLWVSGVYQSTNTVGLASHWNGTGWSYAELPDVPISAVGAASPTSAWVLLAGAHAAYFDGTTWTDKGVVTPASVTAIWGSGPTDAWAIKADDAAATSSTIAHWDGMSWSTAYTMAAGARRIVGASAKDVTVAISVYATGVLSFVHWDGAAWSPVPSSGVDHVPLTAPLAMLAPDDIWAPYGAQATVQHWDGCSWQTMSLGQSTDASPGTFAVGGSSKNVFAWTESGMFRRPHP